jgi:hypothetical protein
MLALESAIVDSINYVIFSPLHKFNTLSVFLNLTNASAWQNILNHLEVLSVPLQTF